MFVEFTSEFNYIGYFIGDFSSIPQGANSAPSCCPVFILNVFLNHTTPGFSAPQNWSVSPCCQKNQARRPGSAFKNLYTWLSPAFLNVSLAVAPIFPCFVSIYNSFLPPSSLPPIKSFCLTATYLNPIHGSGPSSTSPSWYACSLTHPPTGYFPSSAVSPEYKFPEHDLDAILH